MRERRAKYKVNIIDPVFSAKDRRSIVWLSPTIHAKLKTLSVATGLPMQTVAHVLIELGLPRLTKDLVKDITEQRATHMRERIHTSKGEPSYGPPYDKDTRA